MSPYVDEPQQEGEQRREETLEEILAESQRKMEALKALQDKMKSAPTEASVKEIMLETKRLAPEAPLRIGGRCAHCGAEWMSGLDTDDDLVAYGYELYEEYKAFMGGLGKLPKEIIIEIGDRNTIYCDEKRGMFVVSVKSDEKITRHNAKYVFYHEFTHIFQNDAEKGYQCSLTSEYMSSEIEMMAMLGFKSWGDRKRICLSDKIIGIGETTTVREYLDSDLESKMHQIDVIMDRMDFALAITGAIRFMLYYRAKINLCMNHMGREEAKEILPNAFKIGEQIAGKIKDNEYEGYYRQYLKFFDDNILDVCGNIEISVLDKIIHGMLCALLNSADCEQLIKFGEGVGIWVKD
jgi:hypothetical protein